MKYNVFSSCMFFRLHQTAAKGLCASVKVKSKNKAVCILTVIYTGHHICYNSTFHQQPVRRINYFLEGLWTYIKCRNNAVFKRLLFKTYNQVSDKTIGLCITKLYRNYWLLQQANSTGPSTSGGRTKDTAVPRIVLQQTSLQAARNSRSD